MFPSRMVPVTGLGRSRDRKSTRLNSSHSQISYAVFCLKKKKTTLHAFSYSHHTPHCHFPNHNLINHFHCDYPTRRVRIASPLRTRTATAPRQFSSSRL